MDSESLKIGKLYELKVLKAGGEFCQVSGNPSVTVWNNAAHIKRSTKVGVYYFNSGPFLVIGISHDDDITEYQILTPDEKIGWVYLGTYVKVPYYFIELLERKELNP